MAAELEVVIDNEVTASTQDTHVVIAEPCHADPVLEQSAKENDDVKVDIIDGGPTGDKSDTPGAGTVQFSQETDAPEVSVRVFDFDMVKEKTLPRNAHAANLFQTCCGQSRVNLLAWGLVGIFLIVTAIILVFYFAIHTDSESKSPNLENSTVFE